MSTTYWAQGKFTQQAHKSIPDGHFEEEQGRGGFFGPVSHLIKPRPSTRWVSIEGPLRPRLFDVNPLFSGDGPLGSLLLRNSDCEISAKRLSAAQLDSLSVRSFRNADADTIYFCHAGEGVILTEYGLLKFTVGDYVVMPKCVTHTILPSAGAPCDFLVIQSKRSAYREPDRGMVGRHVPYEAGSIQRPNLEAQAEHLLAKTGIQVLHVDVLRLGQITTFTYEDSVYDTLGWKGDLYPYTLSIFDLMPLMSHRVHLPPSAHTTFVADGFVVCSFVKRPPELEKDALKVPFYHQNIDYDEVIFYHAGNFFSRDNLGPGMLTLHPAGFPHGPHPKAVSKMNADPPAFLEEWAVMIDARQPFEVTAPLSSNENTQYWASWKS